MENVKINKTEIQRKIVNELQYIAFGHDESAKVGNRLTAIKMLLQIIERDDIIDTSGEPTGEGSWLEKIAEEDDEEVP